MDEAEAALSLLDSINFRGKIAPEEKVPAWRAIKLLYRIGISDEDCQHLVDGVRRLDCKYAFGPTLKYWIEHVRWKLYHMREAERAAAKVEISTSK